MIIDVIDMNPEDLQSLMDAQMDLYCDEVERIAKELNLSFEDANSVAYLRTRSRHTPELEERLIRELREGKTINIMEWP